MNRDSKGRFTTQAIMVTPENVISKQASHAITVYEPSITYSTKEKLGLIVKP